MQLGMYDLFSLILDSKVCHMSYYSVRGKISINDVL